MFGIVLGCNNTFWGTPVWLMWGKRSNKPKNDRMVGSGLSIGIPTMDLHGQFQGKCGQPNKMPKDVVHLVYHILVYSSYLLVQDWSCIRDENRDTPHRWCTTELHFPWVMKASGKQPGWKEVTRTYFETQAQLSLNPCARMADMPFWESFTVGKTHISSLFLFRTCVLAWL